MIGYMYHMNKKMEIRNVDVSKQAFCGKGGFIQLPQKDCEGGYSVGYRKKKWDKCSQKKAGNSKGI